MLSLSLPLCAALMSFAPAESAPAVQRPSVAPTQPQAGEPAIAPAVVENEAAVAPAEGEPAPLEGEPAPLEGEPAPLEGEPTPSEPAVVEAPAEGGLPSYDSTPTVPTGGDPGSSEGDLPNVDAWGVPVYEEPIDNSPRKGAGFYIGAGALFGGMITKQLFMGLFCSDVYCGYRGNFDRVMAFGVIGLAAGGGWYGGRRAAYFELKEGAELSPVTKRRALGWSLFGVGMAGLLTDMILYHVCYDGAAGPYRQLEGFSYTCTPVASVVTLDFSTVFATVGMALGMAAESKRRHRTRNKFDLSVAPYGGGGQAGLTFAGRF